MKNEVQRPKRKYAENALLHTYKRTRDGGVLFYRPTDHLVYYTLQSVLSRKHKIRVLGSSHMFTHVHEGVYAEDIIQLSSYEHDLSLLFAKEFNRETGRSGPLFAARYGSAPKRNDKDKRSCLIYIFNNPVEKKLVAKAQDDRWTFLPYYDREYPFSRRPVIRNSRKQLLDAIHLVEHEYRSGRYLRYNLLNHQFSKLDDEEKEQLTDFIIQRYFFFDRKACEDLFEDLAKMVRATELTTGKEFEVGEVFDQYSDIPYRDMCSLVKHHGLLGAGLPFLRYPEERLARMAQYLLEHTDASEKHVARFLHWQDYG